MAKHSGMTFSHWPNDRAKGLCATGHSAKPGNQFSLNCNTKKKKKTAHPGPSQPPPISFPDLFCAEERLHLAAPIAWSLGGWRYGSRPPCPISHVTLALETTNHFRASPAWWMDRLVHHTGCTRVCVCVCNHMIPICRHRCLYDWCCGRWERISSCFSFLLPACLDASSYMIFNLGSSPTNCADARTVMSQASDCQGASVFLFKQ